MCLINANSIFGNKIAYFREKYRIHHDFSNLNKAIKQIEHASVLSSEEQSLIDRYGFDFVEINDILCLLMTITVVCVLEKLYYYCISMLYTIFLICV